ncbi:zinc finger protein 488 isoform X1 [Lepisosteus oculatus]|uniref:zinc finger protein 488 isoform X1 n=2 Tax=Lepisosteus oculatus TaxID=7918 RepID=UPI003718EE97
MELGFLPRSFWAGDGKPLHQHVTDLFTSVHVTRDIPAGVSFGPSVLQNTFYDTIAFIALKAADRRNKSYVFRVDAEAMKSSTSALSWLRLVQAAGNREEQNMEAYLKSSQLYFRSTRSIRKDEELLVWYDKELSHLLGFNDINPQHLQDGFKCTKCDQTFKNEHPYLAHCRFLCAQGKTDVFQQKSMETKRLQRVTDFHNIARDLEHRKSQPSEDAAIPAPRKGKPEDADSSRARKAVLLEKTNIANDRNIAFLSRDTQALGPELLAASVLKLAAADRYPAKKDASDRKPSAFTEVRRTKERPKQEKANEAAAERGLNRVPHDRLETDSILHSSGSAFSFVLPNAGAEEQRSAFCKPSRTAKNSSAHPSLAVSGSTEHLGDLADSIAANRVLGYSRLLGSKVLAPDMANAQTPVSRSGSFPYAAEHWPRAVGGQLRTASSLTLLPPSFTSFGVAVQNWCAKCNLSFRMTSDLVFHMRSHHKKEFAVESQVKKRREDKLTCPICHEYFRERHHLSRHMTSHN